MALALHHLATALGPEEARAVEEALRSPGWATRHDEEHTPRELARYAGLPPVVFAVFSCHPSGYRREAALRALHGREEGPGWPFLLLRVNDWVPQVRDAAIAAAAEALTRLAPEWLVRHLPLLLRLNDGGRRDHGPFVARVLERLRAPDVRPVLSEHLSNRSASPHRHRLPQVRFPPPPLV